LSAALIAGGITAGYIHLKGRSHASCMHGILPRPKKH
jgi:hypothetical protein